MKTAKKLTALFLCIAMLLGIGVTNAFAAGIGDEIKWYETYEDGEEIYYTVPYAGTVSEGENEITYDAEGWNRVACEFDAAQAGYYFVTSYYYHDIAEQYQNGEAKNYAECKEMYYMIGEDDYAYGYVYYLPAGKSLFGIGTYYSEPSEITIEYLGDIANVNFDEKALECLILGYDAYYIEEENLVELEGTEYTIDFTNGKTLNGSEWYVLFETNGAIGSGDNALTFDFLGYETEVIAGIYEITDFVESIELQKHDIHLDTKIYYDGHVEYIDLGDKPEYVTINFTDGTGAIVEFYYGPSYANNTFGLPNGKEIYVYAWQEYDYENGGTYFVVGIANHDYIKEECFIEKASFSENFSHFSNEMSTIITYGIEDLTSDIAELFYDLTHGYFSWLMYDLQQIFESYYLKRMFNEISMFISNAF